MKRSILRATLGALAFTVSSSAVPLASQLSPTEIYEHAIATMKSLPPVPFATYDTVITGNGVHIELSRTSNGKAAISLQLGSATQKWTSIYRQSDEMSVLTLADRTRAYTFMPLFDSTWPGAYRWIRYGLSGSTATAGAQPTPAPQGAPSVSGLEEIGAVTAISAGGYNVTGGDAETCPNGGAGQGLNLSAKGPVDDHPLNHVVVEVQSGRFCSLRFSLRGSGGMVSTTGNIELHFGLITDRWLVLGGLVDIQAKIFGFGVKHATVAFRHDNLKLPMSIGAADFAVTSP